MDVEKSNGYCLLLPRRTSVREMDRTSEDSEKKKREKDPIRFDMGQGRFRWNERRAKDHEWKGGRGRGW